MLSARKSCCYIISGFVLINYQAAATLKVPPGFESLAEGQDQQVSVSLYGENLGLYQANVSLDTVRFVDPEILIRDIESKYGSQKPLLDLLSSGLHNPLKRNDYLSCNNSAEGTRCGYIKTKSLEIIFDEKDDEVNLFLPERYIPQPDTREVYYSNAPESHNGFIHQQSVSFVGDKDFQSLSVQGNGTLGLGQSSFANVDWNYTGQRYRQESDSRLSLNNAYVRQDVWKKIYFQAGQMDPRDIFSSAGGSINLGQLQTGKIVGVRVGSTVNWVNHEKIPNATPLTVFLTNSARVDAYRGDRLLESFYLDSGMKQIDTRNFPSGSYTVTLRIYEHNQLLRTQDTPYSSVGYAESNTFQWFMQAGKLSSDSGRNSVDNRQVVVAAARIPLTRSLSLTAGATLLNNVSYAQGALDWSHGFDKGFVDGTMHMRVSYLDGSDGSSGNVQQISYNDGFSLSYYRSVMSSPDCSTGLNHRYSGSGCFESSSILLAVPLSGWNATLGYMNSRNEGHYVHRSQLLKSDAGFGEGAPWESLYVTRSRSREWQAGLSRVFNWREFTLGTSLNAFMRRESGYAGTDRGGFISLTLSRSNEFSSTSLNTSWNSSRSGEGRIGYGASYSHFSNDGFNNEMGASLSGMATQNISALAYKRMGGQYGNASLTLSDSYDQLTSQHSPGLSGSYSSSLAVDKNGFFWGRWGDGLPASAVTFGVEADADDKTSKASVSIDSGNKADLNGNSHAFFTLPGYQQTTIRVGESSETNNGVSSEISKGAGTKTLFMMPGKILNKNVSVVSRYTWLGKMVDSNNQSLNNVIPLNIMSWSPLGNGGFSLESSRPVKNIFVMKGDEYLECPVTIKFQRDVITWLGTIKCQQVSFANLPDAEKMQVNLMTAGIRKENNKTALAN